MAIKLTIDEYVERAMEHAVYKRLPDGTIAGTIPPCPGVIEFGVSPEEARDRLRAALEGWVELGLRLDQPIPEIDGIVPGANSA